MDLGPNFVRERVGFRKFFASEGRGLAGRPSRGIHFPGEHPPGLLFKKALNFRLKHEGCFKKVHSMYI